ncbi:glutathione synthase [Shewanella cyperi]|uniref:glutathione synthase n=1 Tax=Shewanella cyperi TaxID=2814292 RepID=UPI001A94417B|nr:glutathione synthase [Shewanella cyperi]QSX40948.1 glutathione synthase [Shewanella cyperi]
MHATTLVKPVLPAATEPDWSALLTRSSLGLRAADGRFMPLPVSLTPYQLTPAQWLAAKQGASLLGRMLAAIAAEPHWLLTELAPILDGDSLPARLGRLLQESGPVLAQGLALMRHDLMLDSQGQWRWVESNPIAAGMGPLNDLWLELLRPHRPELTFADNQALARQADFMLQAAKSWAQNRGRSRANIGFVVEPREDNIFDQQLLADAMARQGARVQRLTLADLEVCLSSGSSDGPLLDLQGEALDLLYWRTGYNAADYQNEAQWRLRSELERLDILLCPDMALQLAGSKYLQLQLSQLFASPESRLAFGRRFGFSATELAELGALMSPAMAVLQLHPEQLTKLIAQGWWYKRQDEGGGNVARGEQALAWAREDSADSGALLMAPIAAQSRPELLSKLVRGEWLQARGHISELGIFTLGDRADYGGYLLRTKADTSLEGGVHKGFGVLDTLVLAP